MNNTVIIKKYTSPEMDFSDIKRYMGASRDNGLSDEILYECLKECENSFTFKVCYIETEIKTTDDITDFGFFTVKSANLSKCLHECEKSIIFAATVGIEIDRLIARYSRISPVKSLCFQSIGAERIEALCDTFENDIKNNSSSILKLQNRFSPGYGDLDLSVQRNIFDLLECNKRIGLTLTDGMLMIPSKSVTAIIGVKEKQI